ncbi:MAG: peroxiredoxin family protein [Terracidiphilus sp.]
MIQAEVGGAARVDPGNGVQRPGFMIRDFTLVSNRGENIRISSFRGQSNLALVFPGHSDAMRGFLEVLQGHGREFSEQDTVLVAIVPCGPEDQTIPIEKNSPILVLYDKSHAVYQRSGAIENGRPAPLVYLTDRFGEIVSAYVAPEHSMPPSLEEILSTLDFTNNQCPECEPPEWPR